MIEAIPASDDVNLPGLATTETLTRHVNLNYFSEAVSWEGEERLADADSWRITSYTEVTQRCQAKLHIRNLGLQLRVYITPILA